ncbi:MAG: alpha/beta hydrolase [Sulfuriferula sp.]|nr:alpha/beta hydrolase [Sulfuriferula sp.]
MTVFFGRVLIALSCVFLPLTAFAETGNDKIGIVIMHGKGGSPTQHVAALAAALSAQGMLVANLEMPWSGRRNYDVDVTTAESEVESALKTLRQQGATRLFVAGHSQGGAFALYFGNHHAVQGIIAIAPGGNVASDAFRDKLADSVAQARKLIADGNGLEKTRLLDYEGSRGTYPVITPPAAYLTWFDPEGAMNQMKSVKNMNPAIPVLYIAPTNDYPGLQHVKQAMFDALPKNPLTRLYEPDSSHMNAPTASIGEIAAWTTAVANAQ